MLKASTPQAYATALRWAHVPIIVLMVALAGFAFHYLDAGRRWLASDRDRPAPGVAGHQLHGRREPELARGPSLRDVSFLGDVVRVPIGTSNPWMAIGQVGVFLLMIFFADASITAWRQGRRAAAIVVGSILTLLMLAGGGLAVVLFWAGVQAPNTLTLFCLGIVVVMAYALSTDLLRAKQLVVELSEKEQEAALAAEAANLGTFTRDIPRDVIAASDEWRELFGFAPDEPLNLGALLQKIHVDDRAAFGESWPGRSGRRRPAREFRLPLPDGRMRWIAAIGRVEFDSRGRPLRSRGACIDITSRKQAEQEMLRLRQDIAHVGRVSVMGQLASALAHEINQPLGAILRNAEAAALFMQDPSPDLAEITAILEDIRKDDQRAGAVIDRMRALLRRQEVEMKPLDVPQMLDDVVTLLRPDAAARHIALELDVRRTFRRCTATGCSCSRCCSTSSSTAWTPSATSGASGRKVAVAARREGPATLEFSVADTGTGISAGADRPRLRTVLHHQDDRHRHGPVDLAQHRRDPRRPPLGGKQRRQAARPSASPCRSPPRPDGHRAAPAPRRA